MKVFWEKLIFVFLVLVGALGLLLIAMLLSVMFNESVEILAKRAFGVGSKRDVIEFIGLGIAGIWSIFGLFVSMLSRRSAVQGKIAEAQSENNKLIEKGHVQKRFNTAVEHLGSGREAARVASFSEFHHLARDNDDMRERILDILCAHLRQLTTSDQYKAEIGFNIINENYEDERFPWEPRGLAEYADRERAAKEGVKDARPTEEVRSLLDVLFQSRDSQRVWIFAEFKPNLQGAFLMKGMLYKADLQGADLHDADLREANLIGADLQGANLQHAKLRGVNLQGANLQSANLQSVNLLGANLQSANLQDVDLRGSDLRGVDLRGADLQGANLQWVNFERAELQTADLRGADLQAACLWRVDLWEADLRGANLRGADLRWVENLDTVKLDKAKIKGAGLPEGYQPPEDVDND